MCGIAGFSIAEEATFDPVPLARHLLTAIETRGRHAAGAGWTDGEGVWWDKAAMTGSQYATRRLSMSPLTTTAVLHTRFATSGSPKDNRNNHPHVLPGIVGVHNGVLRNWRRLFGDLGVEPESQCDSEAIFALLAYSGLTPTEALSFVEGDASVAWIDTDTPDRLHLARLEGRPLAVASTPRGSLVFASTKQLLVGAMQRASVQIKRVWDVPEWTHLVVDKGSIIDVERFQPELVEAEDLLGWSDDDRWDDAVWNDRDPRDYVPAALRLGVK